MKIRLISDLHIDINDKYPLDLHQDGANDVFTLIAGDVSGLSGGQSIRGNGRSIKALRGYDCKC